MIQKGFWMPWIHPWTDELMTIFIRTYIYNPLQWSQPVCPLAWSRPMYQLPWCRPPWSRPMYVVIAAKGNSKRKVSKVLYMGPKYIHNSAIDTFQSWNQTTSYQRSMLNPLRSGKGTFCDLSSTFSHKQYVKKRFPWVWSLISVT